MPASTPVRFDNRVAIVTGSGRGLGRQHAIFLASLGASVVVNSVNPSTAQATVDDITKAGGKAVACTGSVSDADVAEALVKKAIDTFGRIDIVVNNAGTYDMTPFEQTTAATLRGMLSIHVEGSYNITRAAWPHMQKQKYGRVNAVATTAYTYTVKEHMMDEGVGAFMKANLPAADPSRAVVWLTHKDCKSTGEVYGAQGRIMSRIFLAETKGFQGSRQDAWDVKTVRDNWDKVVDEKDYAPYKTTNELSQVLFGRLSGASS